MDDEPQHTLATIDEPIASPEATSVYSSDDDCNEPSSLFTLTLHLHNKPIDLAFHSDDVTIQDLSEAVADDLHIPPSNQKFLITPKVGLLKPPFKDPSLHLRTLQDKKIVLMGATTAEVESLEADLIDRRARLDRRRNALQAGRRVQASKRQDWKRMADDARYTFFQIRPLPHLPNPDKSQRFLERLAADAGIKTSMRKHGFAVGLLTEMDPAEHTTHESRTLGLNRNRGEVIELRLRTDAYDGYRDYKVIRKTLCHELAHNIWGEHDRHFWKLCREIEEEVEKNDWRRGGHSVGGEEFYNPADDGMEEADEEADHGGWSGGSYVLGGHEGGSSSTAGDEALSRREIVARAAEERMRRQKEAKAEERKAKDATAEQ